jgi:ATP-dependent RNA helicase RhlE
VIHANKGQNSRINAFNEFRAGAIRILVTTDVTARGVDVEQVSHVINFEIPRAYEEYVHRIGRTGRAEKSGIAISFVNEVEKIHLIEIETLISNKVQELQMPRKVEICKTAREESQQIAMEIDKIKRARDPDFKGAFHEKKRTFSASAKKPSSRKKKKRRI